MRLFAGLLLATAAWASPEEAVSHLRPWPKGGGNPAVVFFIASHADDPEFGTNTAFHAGGGLFVTCVHAFESFEKFEILTSAGARARVDRIAAWDRGRDIAVFTVDPSPEGLAALELSDRSPAPGEKATLCGFPGNSWREEILPVMGPWAIAGWGDLLMLDGIAEAGNSGGPILDGKGRALGMLLRSAFAREPGSECGPSTHAVSSREIVRLVEAGRAALKEAPGALSTDGWVRREMDPWQGIPDQVHRAEWRKDFQGAERVIRKRLAENPGEARTLALLAELRRKQGDMEGAAGAVDRAMAADPRDCRALFELGQVKEHRGEANSAIAAYGQCAQARKPGMTFNDLIVVVDALGRRANLLDRANRLEEAVQAYRDELGITPYHACEHRRLGDALGMLDRTREAVDSYRRTLALRPEQPLVVLRLAIAESSAGDGKAALEDARRAVAMDGKSAVGLFLLGYFAWREGRGDEARSQVGPLGDLARGLAERLADHLAGREDRRPSFAYSIDGGLRVKPLPAR